MQELDELRLLVQSFLEDRQSAQGERTPLSVNLLNVDSHANSVLSSRLNVPADRLYNEMNSLFDSAEKENQQIREKLPACNKH